MAHKVNWQQSVKTAVAIVLNFSVYFGLFQNVNAK